MTFTFILKQGNLWHSLRGGAGVAGVTLRVLVTCVETDRCGMWWAEADGKITGSTW